jgi:hypothetical protein
MLRRRGREARVLGRDGTRLKKGKEGAGEEGGTMVRTTTSRRSWWGRKTTEAGVPLRPGKVGRDGGLMLGCSVREGRGRELGEGERKAWLEVRVCLKKNIRGGFI